MTSVSEHLSLSHQQFTSSAVTQSYFYLPQTKEKKNIYSFKKVLETSDTNNVFFFSDSF